MKRTASFAASLLLIIAFTPTARLNAQVLYGSLIVDVRDQTGGAVPGAEVTITRHETGLDPKRHVQRVGAADVRHRAAGHLRGARRHFRIQGIRTTGVSVFGRQRDARQQPARSRPVDGHA